MKVRTRGEARAGHGERGSALVLSLMAVATVVVLSASFSQFASAVADRQAQAIDRKQAFYLAEAGLADAFAGFTCGKSGVVGSMAAPALLGEGVFWVESTEIMPGVFRLDSHGRIGSGRAKLSLVAQRGIDDVAALGMFSNGALSVTPGSVIDGYDSTLGAYATQSDKSGASVGSNAGVSLTGTVISPTVVQGDVTPGVGLTVTTSGSVTISGTTEAAIVPTELPAVSVPAVTLAGPHVHDSPYPLVIPAGKTGYESLAVLGGSEVVLHGPAEVVIGSLSLAALGQLSFDTSEGPVRLYVTEAVDLAATSVLSTSSTNPAEVVFQVPGETELPVTIRSSGPFHGVIYAPDSQLVLGSGFEAFGAVVAEAMSLEGSVALHFDRNLIELATEEGLPVVLSWRLSELGSLADPGADPFEDLGLVKGLLVKPALAHADQNLAIDYYDASNVYHQYVGPESSFDWNVVQRVIYATRDGEEVLIPFGTTATKSGLRKAPMVAPIIDGAMI